MSFAFSLRKLNKSFDGTPVFRDLDMDIEAGMITAIFGPNGSGKSTLLGILSGMEQADSGTCVVLGQGGARVGYAFQNYRETLLPWRTVFGNIAFPLELQGLPVAVIRERVDAVEKFFRPEIDLEKYPYELSGGQQQIVSFLRAVIVEPTILLLDEPFSALDYENVLKFRVRLEQWQMRTGSTIVIVSHSAEEAAMLAGRTIILSQRPAEVVESIPNPLPYPRTIETMQSAKFAVIKSRILVAFQWTMRTDSSM